ncbi:MAG: hypothetical protein JKY56_05235 [Kofleriaceae bacterium]|nr:hypothetical protein [Kofleriaceae bacterium]
MGRIWDVRHAVLAMFICITWSSLADAQENPGVVQEDKSVVVIIDSGTADLILESSVRATTEARLAERGYSIVENVRVAGDKPARLLACSGQEPCIVEVLSGIPAAFVVFASMRSDEQDGRVSYKIVARTFEVSTGRVVARIMKRCEACKDELDLAPFSGVVIDALLDEMERSKEPTQDVPADTDNSEKFQAVDVSQKTVGVEKAVGHAETGSRRSILPYVAIGGGISALGTGVALLLLDGPVIENGLRQPEERATKLGGYLFMGAGGALLGVGAWLLITQSSDAESDSMVVIAPSSSGAKLLWRGNF